MSAVVSDSSPLNYPALLSDFDILRQIYGTLVIPQAVYVEVVERAEGYPVRETVIAALGQWISVAAPPDEWRVTALRDEYRLDAGESEAIVVAGDSGSPLLMDEQRGVRCARSHFAEWEYVDWAAGRRRKLIYLRPTLRMIK